MKRTDFLACAGAAIAAGTAAAAAAQTAAESAIALTTPTGKIAGTLTLPPKLPAPVALIVAGSGPTDRDGNSGPIHPDTYRLLAAALAGRGFASVRYDKRGIGESASAAASESDLRFEHYVADAAAWLRVLRSDQRFGKIVLAGHSEGSLVGMLAVVQAPADAFVSLEGAGRPAATVLREQLQPKLSAALYAQADAVITQLQQGHTVANPPAELAALFRPSVQPYLISWFKYDPAADIAKVTVPVTIVQGTADIQVTMADADALKRGAPSARLVVVQGMNHVLKYAPDTKSQAAILKGYEDSSLPVAPEAVAAVATVV
ncbi:MAG TPA: alpha/beta fold hydrolase [Candidatus Tumulicola sp.]|nr:alpha/beta fold hydrolase [Candidatus Tumulicola sp.]